MQASKLPHAEVSKDFGPGEGSRAAVLHLVPFGEEAPHLIADVMIDRLIGQRKRAIAEVSFPTRQKSVQAFAYRRPRRFVARRQKIANFRLEPLHTSLRRTRAGIEAPVPGAAMRAERVTKKVKAFRSSVFH